MATVTLKAGEAKTLRFTVTDSDDAAVDLSAATLTFTVKQHKDDDLALISKDDADFDTTQATSGIVDVDVSSTDTDLPAFTYTAELKIVFSATNIDKSADISFIIQQAVA